MCEVPYLSLFNRNTAPSYLFRYKKNKQVNLTLLKTKRPDNPSMLSSTWPSQWRQSRYLVHYQLGLPSWRNRRTGVFRRSRSIWNHRLISNIELIWFTVPRRDLRQKEILKVIQKIFHNWPTLYHFPHLSVWDVADSTIDEDQYSASANRHYSMKQFFRGSINTKHALHYFLNTHRNWSILINN